MKRRIAAMAVLGLFAATAACTLDDTSPRERVAPPPRHEAPDDSLGVYTARLDAPALAALRNEGVDVAEAAPTSARDGSPAVEVVLSDRQAGDLTARGVVLDPRRPTDATGGHDVFRPYSGPGGISEELTQLAAAHRDITKLVTIGRTVQGQDIVALKVTRRARSTRDGQRPAVLYMGGQHAREWITPEMVRRLAHQVVEGYSRDAALTDLVDGTELWFVPVANPDGYDYTFTPDHRQWRKNLRDNDRDGRITVNDGVDLNRNYPTRWRYDDEGSSSQPGSEAYRGTGPASEPEVRAVDGLLQRVGFEFVVNYHSAAERLLYGTAFQAATATPDDLVYEALAGDDAAPAVPGYDPDLWSELYTANGEATEHGHVSYGALGFTPEMSTCQTASRLDPADRWDPAACPSAFDFPDDETLIAGEFAKNLPFALATARSAADPGHPVSPAGRATPEFVVHRFDVSYGDPQVVAVTARRDQRMRRLNYRVNGGPAQRARVSEWEGGERYGGERDRWYAEFRGEVQGTQAGDSVEVWFTAGSGRNEIQSEHFTYTVASASGAQALILASEDYTGVNPTYPAGTAAPRYVDTYAAALDANGVSHATWDVDAQGVPDPLGVLSHFDAVVWETGADRLVQDPEDFLTDTFLLGPLPDLAVAERQQFLTLAVRDYLNEGGKLVHAGESAQYYGVLGRSLGALYYGLNGAPDRDCAVTDDFLADCLLLTDDFAQYYLGVTDRAPFVNPAGVDGAGPLAGLSASFGGPAVAENPLNEAGGFSLTSDVLAPADFPLFAGEASSRYRGAANVNPFGPVEGSRYAGALPAQVSYQRLGRTVDLSGVAAAESPTLALKLSFSTLVTFHHAIVEAAPSGTDEWTTLRDLNGRTSPGTPSGCAGGGLLDLHPFLRHYLAQDNPGATCRSAGTTGTWNAFTGDSPGWVDARFDLSPYAGGSVDVKVSYVTDPVVAGVSGGVGVFVDDTRVLAGGRVLDADGFEGPTSRWTVEGPPPGGPVANQGDFAIGTALVDLAASVSTEDTVLFGFGIESLATPEDRATMLGRALDHLLQ
jgi:Zinc carboxypeptidase/Immune inhibitor A peptidase M6